MESNNTTAIIPYDYWKYCGPNGRFAENVMRVFTQYADLSMYNDWFKANYQDIKSKHKRVNAFIVGTLLSSTLMIESIPSDGTNIFGNGIDSDLEMTMNGAILKVIEDSIFNPDTCKYKVNLCVHLKPVLEELLEVDGNKRMQYKIRNQYTISNPTSRPVMADARWLSLTGTSMKFVVTTILNYIKSNFHKEVAIWRDRLADNPIPSFIMNDARGYGFSLDIDDAVALYVINKEKCDLKFTDMATKFPFLLDYFKLALSKLVRTNLFEEERHEVQNHY